MWRAVLSEALSSHGEPTSLDAEGGYQQGRIFCALRFSNVDTDKKQFCS